MMLSAIAVALATTPPNSSAWTAQKPAVSQAEIARHGPHAQIDSILIKRGYALVHGKGFHDVLHFSHGTWTIVCDLSRSQPTARTLETDCGVSASIAAELAAEEPVNLSVAQGDFSTAAAEEQQAYASISGPEKQNERARLQKLTTLNQEMQLQQITRAQAIQQWNQSQFSWALP